jgi:hypothetical protein
MWEWLNAALAGSLPPAGPVKKRRYQEGESMLARHRPPLFAGALALLAAGLTASAAYAATGSAHPAGGHRASTAATWSVSESADTGGSSKGVLTDRTTGSKIKCYAQFDYLFAQKMGLPSDIATLNFVTFSNCTLPGGAAITLTTSTAKLPMLALSFNSRRNLGVTSGEFTGLDISLSGAGCSGVLDGTAAGANDGTVPYLYYNNPNLLTTGRLGDLHIYNVSGCTGLFSTGDTFTLSFTQTFSGLFITSP